MEELIIKTVSGPVNRPLAKIGVSVKIYSVGGSVRDFLLGIKSQDLDYLVTGATPEQMIKLGYRQVGKEFPVFLHPESADEHALARTELKSGVGYGGFTCAFGPDVTVEEDLERRDLTINAIAKDEEGNMYDPFGGLNDIKNKVLRHVSSAFEEDPVRVLRVARFMARYKHLGFKVAEETQLLMQNMANNGRLDELTSERVWKEASKAIMEPNPEAFFMTLKSCGALARIFPEIDSLFGIKEDLEKHPEGDSGVHTMMALKQAQELSNDLGVVTATLLHDLGKNKTPQDEWPKHTHSAKNGVALVTKFCKKFKVPTDIRILSEKMSELHPLAHNTVNMTPGGVLKLIECLDGIRKPNQVKDFMLACKADAQGRLHKKYQDYPQEKIVISALVAARGVTAQPFLDKGCQGKEIGELMRQERLKAVQKAIDLFKLNLSSDNNVDLGM